MSLPKVKCPTCGMEWAGAVVFCGECGTPITSPSAAPGDRAARVPPAPQTTKPATRMAAPTKPSFDGKPAKPVADAKTSADGGARASRPSDAVEHRRTLMGTPTLVSPSGLSAPVAPPPPAAAPPAEPAKPARKEAPPKRQRKPSIVIAAEPTTQEEAEKLLEALDAGFDSIVRPTAELPVLPISPSLVPEIPAEKPAAPVEETAAAKLVETPAPPPPPAAPVIDEATRRAQHESDMAEVRALFTEMAIAHARPLRDFMIEVSWGDPTREWIDVAQAASSALRRAADALEMPELGVALDGFIAALDRHDAEPAERTSRDLLLGAYGKLVEMLPAAFALEGERGRREPVIVRALLLQVPGVQKVTLDKLYAAGLTSLDMLYAAGPRELAETTGLEPELAARIHDRFQRYRREAAELDPAKDRAAERAELAALLIELTKAHDEHERLARAWTPDAAAARVRARKERNDVLLAISVLLARLGEVDRIKALEKVPFAQKIRDLEQFLDEAKRKAARP